MGLITRGLGGPEAVQALGNAAANVAEVFRPNATRRMELSAEAHRAALDSHSDEFQYVRQGWFDKFVNGLNRLPRPMLALGTLGLFVYAMADPEGFTARMAGLEHVPEPLWWLLGAIVSFYFGARELHYFRTPRQRAAEAATGNGVAARSEHEEIASDTAESAREVNPALQRWLEEQLASESGRD